MKKCSVVGCDGKHHAQGLCKKCYMTTLYKSRHLQNVKDYQKRNITDVRATWRERYYKNKNDPDEQKKRAARYETYIKSVKGKVCAKCGKVGKTQFHHISYEPNIAIELCRECHENEHR